MFKSPTSLTGIEIAKTIDVFVEDVAPNLQACFAVDVRPRLVHMDFEEPRWRVEGTPGSDQRVCQESNNQPSPFVCPGVLRDVQIVGSWKTNNATDDDWVGLVWGMNDDVEGDKDAYYLFSWRKNGALGHADCADGSVDDPGMYIRRIDERLGTGNLQTCAQIVGSTDGSAANHQILKEPSDFAGAGARDGWFQDVEYSFELEYRSAKSSSPTRLVIYSDQTGSKQEIARVTIEDKSIAEGKFGFFTLSQDNICFSSYNLSGLTDD